LDLTEQTINNSTIMLSPDLSKYPLSSHPNDGLSNYGSRDVVGYGSKPPTPQWPNNGKVALNFVLNYEEGGENCLLHGDTESEKLLSEIVGAGAYQNQRHANMESLYDYGSRAGFWRLHRLLTSQEIPTTVFAVGMALERNPEACEAMKDAGWEVASHGYRWWDYQDVSEEVEREHIRRTVEIHEQMLGKRPVGMYQGKPNVNTRQLVMEEGGFLYDSDSYADDLPYWTWNTTNENDRKPHLIIPYTLSENDMRFAIPNGFSHGDEFFIFLKDSLDYLIEEGRSGSPKMMSVGLHCRLVGRPGRAAGLKKFLEYVKSLGDDVFLCTREQIANHWYEHHYPAADEK
jgi:allantoinase